MLQTNGSYSDKFSQSNTGSGTIGAHGGENLFCWRLCAKKKGVLNKGELYCFSTPGITAPHSGLLSHHC